MSKYGKSQWGGPGQGVPGGGGAPPPLLTLSGLRGYNGAADTGLSAGNHPLEGGHTMPYVRKKRVLPVYFIGLTWLVWALLRPLYRPAHFIAAALASALAYYVGQMLFPDSGEELERVQTPAASGGEVEGLLAERERVLSEMRGLNASIRDEKLSLQISHLEQTTGRILDEVVARPDKLPQIRRFLNYYLPTTLKLLRVYDRLEDSGGTGENIAGTRERIDDILSTVCTAYDRQLDALYGEEALDIASDIAVLEQLLAQEGLGGEEGPTALRL